LRPQVQILDWICSRTYQVGAEKNGLKLVAALAIA
jgi:hypothetical protein